MNIDKEAAKFLCHLLGKFSGQDLSDDEGRAAFRLLCTLPDHACIKDFMKAASPEEVTSVGLPAEIADTLAPLIDRLERGISYAGKFASLFESRAA